jgi:hypothetical protein
MPRKLQLLDIYDFPTEAKAQTYRSEFTYADRLDYVLIPEWAEAVRLISSEGSEFVRADLVAFDISFRDDSSTPNENWSMHFEDNSPVKPIGPLLALPFINHRPIVAMMPYSAHWQHIEQSMDPFFWATMGLLLAKRSQTAFHWDDLSARLHQLKTSSNLHIALPKLLKSYRDLLMDRIENEVVQPLPGITKVIEFLRKYRSQQKDDREPLNLIDDELCLDLAYSSSTDSIYVGSLFADFFREDDGSCSNEDLKEMILWLRKADRGIAWQAFEVMKRVLDPNISIRGVKDLRDEIRRSIPNCTDLQIADITRKCVLFAHVEAIHSCNKATSTEVQNIFGFDVRPYRDLFFYRDTTESGPHHSRCFPDNRVIIKTRNDISNYERGLCHWYARTIPAARKLHNDPSTWPEWLKE